MKTGDYVRTDKGEIGKVTSVAKDNLGFGNMEFCNTEPFVYGNIVKSSPNVIDLIELGDIVNYGLLGGGMVIFKKDGEITTNTILFSTLKEKDIKKVITKEQIENQEYEVK